MALQFVGKLVQIFDGAQGGRAARWIASNFFDKVVFTNPSVAPQYWPGTGIARPIPGLPRTETYDGITVFNGHILLWKGSIIKWSKGDDLATWIPVALTASTGRGLVSEEYSQPDDGATSGWVFMSDVSGSFTVGQFVRVVSYEDDPTRITYDFYTVSEVASSSVQQSTPIGVTQTVLAGDTTKLYLGSVVKWSDGAFINLDGIPVDLQIVSQSREVVYSDTLVNVSGDVPDVGGTITLPLSKFPFDLEVGDQISIGDHASPGLDVYEVVTLGQVLIAKRLGVGVDQVNIGAAFPADSFVVFQPWINVKNVGTADVTILKSNKIVAVDALKLKNLNYTGATEPGVSIPTSSVVETVDKNDAGELINIGSKINGDIFAIEPLGEYAHIIKEASFQLLQDVGIENGTFFPRSVIFEEGPIGRYAWCSIDTSAIVFWGRKEFYIYRGGEDLEPIGLEATIAIRNEVDESKVDEIVAFHNKIKKEVWFIYPSKTTSDTKVFIYNYQEKTSVIDVYSSDLNGIASAGVVNWEVAPTWESLDTSVLWNNGIQRWYEFSDSGALPYVLLGIVGDEANPEYGEVEGEIVPRVLVFGRQQAIASNDDCVLLARECLAETPDLDFGDSAAWKYVDTVQIGIHVAAALDIPAKVEVWVGARDNLDSDLRWAGPGLIEVSGNGNITTKVDVRNSGRYIRLRIRSNQAGVYWRLSYFKIFARVGGTF